MKKHLLFPLLTGLALVLFINTNRANPGVNFGYIQRQSLAEYAGKYRLNKPGGPAPLLGVSVVDSALVFTQLWDGKKMPVKHTYLEMRLYCKEAWIGRFNLLGEPIKT